MEIQAARRGVGLIMYFGVLGCNAPIRRFIGEASLGQLLEESGTSRRTCNSPARRPSWYWPWISRKRCRPSSDASDCLVIPHVRQVTSTPISLADFKARYVQSRGQMTRAIECNFVMRYQDLPRRSWL